MKLIFTAALSFLGSGAFSCTPDAKIIAKVHRTVSGSRFFCKAYVDPDSVSYYKSNPACPLPLIDVETEGVIVAYTEGQHCPLVGDEMNGGVYSNGADIFLE